MDNLNDLAEHAAEAVKLLTELANQNRLLVLCCLGQRELSVSELNEYVPLSQSALSQHLARMREAELVTTRRNGQNVYYKIANENVMKVITTLKSIYCPE